MKLYAQEILKRNIEFALFTALSAMFLVSMALNMKVLLKNKEPLLIAIDGNGTRIVQEAQDPIFKTEAVSFIQNFIVNSYNFNHDNFMQRIGLATTMMSDALWKSKRTSILDLKKKVEADEISVAGEIERISRDEHGNYHILVKAQEKSRLSIQDRKLKILVGIKAVPRSQNNPWGMEVDSYEESIIRN